MNAATHTVAAYVLGLGLLLGYAAWVWARSRKRGGR